MMRIIFLSILLISTYSNSFAQFKIKKDWEYDPTDNCFAIKRLFVNVHYDVPLLIKKNWQPFDKNGDFTTNTIGPIGMQAEYAFSPKIGITGSYNFINSKASWGQIEYDSIAQKNFTYNKGFTYVAHTASIGVQNHMFYNKFIDAYIGAELGYSAYTYAGFTAHPKNTIVDLPSLHSPFHYMVYFGIRAYIISKVALFTNVGISDISNAKLGIVYRFGY
jgi:hypothetical protein